MSELVAGPRTARWTATASEGVYRFQVNRADDAPVDPDDPDDPANSLIRRGYVGCAGR